MKVSVLVPVDRKADTVYQAYALAQWRSLLPGAEVVRGVNDDTPYNRAAAINAAADEATGDVLVIADRDLIYPHIRSAVNRIQNGSASWVMSDTTVRLNRLHTHRVQRGGPLTERLMRSAGNDRYRSKGGIIVLTRKAWDAVGGMDRRYQGWGGEDTALMCALRTLVGPPERRGVQWHMHHSYTFLPGTRTKAWAGQTQRHDEVRHGIALQYKEAADDPSAMRDLIDSRYESESVDSTDETDGDV